MSCKIIALPLFLRQAKRLHKKYSSFKDDLWQLYTDLSANPSLGSDLGNGLRKVRMAIASKNKGKSGGARVITFNCVVKHTDDTLYLLLIYDKSERENITKNEILTILESLGLSQD